MAKSVHWFLPDLFSNSHTILVISWNLAAYHGLASDTLSFFSVLPVQGRKPLERWSVPPFPFVIQIIYACPPGNLLVVAE